MLNVFYHFQLCILLHVSACATEQHKLLEFFGWVQYFRVK